MQALKVVLAQIAALGRVPVHGEAVRELLQSSTHTARLSKVPSSMYAG